MGFTSVIVVAGGKGKRMGADIPKQFLNLNGLPVLFHTLILLDSVSKIDEIILVLPQDHIDWFEEEFNNKVNISTTLKITQGGMERQDSVKCGLNILDEKSDIVLIHDGVRPFVTEEEILNVIAQCNNYDGVILGLPVFETIKRCTNNKVITSTIPRENMYLAQTPQGFKTQIIKKAHDIATKKGIKATDDASILEELGFSVKIVDGSRINIKITTPADLEFAKSLCG